ncbi:MAG: class I mannose-6-phosphate isomerase [Acidobacteria bacterium]|nr:MAG: class I mannose-6-phosphate isomerase [Acidobacteriota bacterium]
MMDQPTGPLRLEPVFLPKIWAAEDLPPELNRALHVPSGTGEVWLASDRHHPTPVAEGELAGIGLDELMDRWPRWLAGGDRPVGFPLLFKVLSIGQWLSVQVHPDDQSAARLEGEPWGKSEAWHILAAEQDSHIIHGLEPGIGRDGLAQALADGRIGDILARVPAAAGDTFHLTAGTVHAPGPGLTILEIQQSSDLTYRFYDWDRPGLDGAMRELHIDKAMEVMRDSGPAAPTRSTLLTNDNPGVELLVEDPHFYLLRIEITGSYTPPIMQSGPRLLFVLAGGGRLMTPGCVPLTVTCGQTWLIPAGLPEWSLDSDATGTVFFEAGCGPAWRGDGA